MKIQKILYKNYTIKIREQKTVSNSYSYEWKFDVSDKNDENFLGDFRFLIPGIEIDLFSVNSIDPGSFFKNLCLDKIKEILDNRQTEKFHYVLEYRGSIFIKRDEDI